MGLLFSQAPASMQRHAFAQDLPRRVESDLAEVVRTIVGLFLQVGEKTRGEVLGFLNRLEYLNVESEIDRLVGSPWELSDSSYYKLSLAPQHVAYPVYDQLVSQMTRLDDLRTRRVQNLTVDAVPLIAVNLRALESERSGQDLLDSLLHYLNAREITDVGVFLLAQQPFFPQTEEDWRVAKRKIASRKDLLALTGLGLGALFEAGAFSNSGTLRRFRENRYRLGWYGGFSRLGYHLQPLLRGGMTGVVPGVEVSAGLAHQVRPTISDLQTAVEVAVRESYLHRFAAASGWDSFVQLAFRRVLSAQAEWQGDRQTGRIGVFMKRPQPFHLRNLILRTSAETESDFLQTLRFAVGVGIDYPNRGLSTVLQSSRTFVSQGEGGRRIETRTGIFLAGTMESPAAYFVDIMETRGRLLRESWQSYQGLLGVREETLHRLGMVPSTGEQSLKDEVRQLRRQTQAIEEARLALIENLASYLETRRRAYALERWSKTEGELHGPVQGEILLAASSALFSRLTELVDFLEKALVPLLWLRSRYTELRLEAEQQRVRGQVEQANRLTEETLHTEQRWREESARVEEALHLYNQYRTLAERISVTCPALIAKEWRPRQASEISRRLMALVARALP